jgi:hypothetical protein
MKMCRERILRERLEMARHNLYCYSKNLLCTAPKEGNEEQYNDTKAEVEILEAWLKEFHSSRTDSTREFVGIINGIAHGKTYDGKPTVDYIEFEVETGADYLHGDVRTFHIAQEVLDWFIGGEYGCGKYDSEKDHRESRLLKITVDRIEYIRSIEWVVKEDVDVG